MKVYISADIEGVSNVVSREETGTAGFDFNRARERMTREVIAAMDGAREAGATGFVVSDSHGSGLNIIPEMMPRDAELVRSWPRPLMMMEGIQTGGFRCAFLIGYHAGAQWNAGVLAHTLAGKQILSLRANGNEWPEAGLSAAVAGEFGVPVTLLSGDDAFLAETERLFGPFQSVMTKSVIGFFSARSKSPQAVEADLRAKAAAAFVDAKNVRPFLVDGPLTIDLTLKFPAATEVLCLLPTFERVGATGVRFQAKNAVEASRVLQFVLMTVTSMM